MPQVTRSVIVTGSSSGIGLDIARAFLDRGAGVVLNGRDAASDREGMSGAGAPP